MKQLEKTFIGKGQVRGFRFTLIQKNGKAYVYQVDTGDSTHYEVFRHRENERFDCVTYPSDKAFGLWAKTSTTMSDAIDNYEYFTDQAILNDKKGEVDG